MNRLNFVLILLFFLNKLYSQSDNILEQNTDYLKSYQLYLRGNISFSKKNYDMALLNYKQALKIYNQYPEVYYKLIKIYFLKNEYNIINNYINQCIKYKGSFKDKADLYDFYRISGDFYEIKKDYNQAIAFYLNLLVLKKDSFFYKYKLGYLYFKIKNNIKSEEYLDLFLVDVKKEKKLFQYIQEYNNALKILININIEKNDYLKSFYLLKELYIQFPEEDVLDKLIIMSNNLKYYITNK